MDENMNHESEEASLQPEAAPAQASVPMGAKERLYSKITLTKKQMDVIVTILIIATVLAFVLGALIGNGIINL